MPTTCKDDDGNISVGDAVCISGWDGAPNNRPKVKRALKSNLTGAYAKTVYGVSSTNSTGPATTVSILVSGEVADPSITGLSTGPGKSRLVVTDFENGTAALTCKLRHVDDTPPVPPAFVVGSSDESGTLAIQPRHATDEGGFTTVFSVVAYGADPSGVTDSTAGIQRAIHAMSASGAVGGTLFFPRGTYSCLGDIHVYKQLVLTGVAGGNNRSLSRIVFAAGKQIIVWHLGSPYGGIGQGTIIRDIDIETSKVTTTARTTRRYFVGETCIDPGSNHCYLECIVEGDAAGGSVLVDYEGDYSSEFETGKDYHYGQKVRGSTDQNAIAADGSNLIVDAVFMVTTPGPNDPPLTSGGVRPVWDTVAGNPTSSGAVVFTAIAGAESFILDGDCVWAAKTHAGIWMKTRTRCESVYVGTSTTAGFTIRANANYVLDNANGWQLDRCFADQCGMGVFVSGGNTNVGIGSNLVIDQAGADMPGNGGIGIHDASQLGGVTWISCQIANLASNGGGPAISKSSFARSVFVNMYMEDDAGAAETKAIFVPPCVFIGGVATGRLQEPIGATVIDDGSALGCRNLVGINKTGDDKLIRGYVGNQDQVSTLAWGHEDDADITAIGTSKPLPNWPEDWWTFGRFGDYDQQAFAVPRPGAGTWPSNTPVDTYALWISRDRVHVGVPENGDPPCIGFGTEQPDLAMPADTRYFVQGSILWNSAAQVGDPIGWMCTVSGAPGSWAALAAL